MPNPECRSGKSFENRPIHAPFGIVRDSARTPSCRMRHDDPATGGEFGWPPGLCCGATDDAQPAAPGARFCASCTQMHVTVIEVARQ